MLKFFNKAQSCYQSASSMGYVRPEEEKEHVPAHSYVPEDADEFRLICLGNEDQAK